MKKKWSFWIDRGGTFTDIVGFSPDGKTHIHKLLSENPEVYRDAAIQGIRDLMGRSQEAVLSAEDIEVVKMGSTVATNALLERKGAKTLLVITKGFRDALVLGDQHRSDLFALDIHRPEALYDRVVEMDERLNAQGEVLRDLDERALEQALRTALEDGMEAVAIVGLHAYLNPVHELAVETLAKNLGFGQVSSSHRCSALIKLIGRGDTTVVDAYLTPILKRYVDQVSSELVDVPLEFMQSNGGLTSAERFEGKDAVLSGPAGGLVGAIKTAEALGFDHLVTFDMGGTSTDVAHYATQVERRFDHNLAGVRMRVPMLDIHTVAAGGGSICRYDGGRFTVGPESAGADPGPTAYGRGGPLTVTDCNVLLGRCRAEFFPKVFGQHQDQPLDETSVREKFEALAADVNGVATTPNLEWSAIESDMDPSTTVTNTAPSTTETSVERCAMGFLNIAVEHMARAIKKISLERGHDISGHAMQCFGGAGGQHACWVADALGLKRIILHPYAGVLSAYGMGLADRVFLRRESLEQFLSGCFVDPVADKINKIKAEWAELHGSECDEQDVKWKARVYLKIQGSDQVLALPWLENTPLATARHSLTENFHADHQRLYGYRDTEAELLIDSVELEGIMGDPWPVASHDESRSEEQPLEAAAEAKEFRSVYMDDQWQDVPFYWREDLQFGQCLQGPAVVLDQTGTNVIESSWRLEVCRGGALVLQRKCENERSEDASVSVKSEAPDASLSRDPISLELFNHMFMSLAEQMGTRLQQTARSVNIKERLDYSCAVFTAEGSLVSNAPHMPVHLGSMGESVKAVIAQYGDRLKEGDAVVLNNPYRGGTHIPDVTLVSPCFRHGVLRFFVASRGHHADMGGISPGSMPAFSTNISEEGVMLDGLLLVEGGVFHEAALRAQLLSGPYPVRNVEHNVADLRAQLAANQKGIAELQAMMDQMGETKVIAYAEHVQDYAEETVRSLIEKLQDGQWCVKMDNGSQIAVRVEVQKDVGTLLVDFTGTSPQCSNNFNAPKAVCRAAVLYVIRSLVRENIPLNDGCLRPVQMVIPEASMLAPDHPAAVVAGNVETSQVLTNALYGALGVLAAAQGTMNNLTFGNAEHQYYETVCGGAGAGDGFHGCSGIHTHMTNSRLTDPEVLESRFPVLLEEFRLRPHSGGQGRFCGGDGVVRRLKFLETMDLHFVSNHRQQAPFGLCGGDAGLPGKQWLERAGEHIALQACDQTVVQKGDVFHLETPGGGGYGC